MPRIKLVNSLHSLDFASRQLIHPANGQQLGPFGLEQLLQNGLTHQVMVWRAGFDGWKLASQVPELASLLSTVPPPPPAAA